MKCSGKGGGKGVMAHASTSTRKGHTSNNTCPRITTFYPHTYERKEPGDDREGRPDDAAGIPRPRLVDAHANHQPLGRVHLASLSLLLRFQAGHLCHLSAPGASCLSSSVLRPAIPTEIRTVVDRRKYGPEPEPEPCCSYRRQTVVFSFQSRVPRPLAFLLFLEGHVDYPAPSRLAALVGLSVAALAPPKVYHALRLFARQFFTRL